MKDSKLFDVREYWTRHVSSDVDKELVKSFGYHLDWYWQGITTLKQCSTHLTPLFNTLVDHCRTQQEADVFEATMAAVDHEFTNFDGSKHVFAYSIQENGIGGAILVLVFGCNGADNKPETEQLSASI